MREFGRTLGANAVCHVAPVTRLRAVGDDRWGVVIDTHAEHAVGWRTGGFRRAGSE